ncbi:MAG: mechanosensitive ion channel family protein [Syntrophales bacterium]
MKFEAFLSNIWHWILPSGIKIILVLVLTFVALKVARILSKRFVSTLSQRQTDVEAQKRTETLGSVLRHILTVIILIVTSMVVLKELGIEIGPILAAAGVVGLAVGFGAQSLVQDVISGFFILLEDQVRVGDVVEVAGRSGIVEKVTLRMTILRDLAGNVHYIRNGKIDLVTNMTKEYSRYVFSIGIAYREDVDQVIEVVKQLDEELRNDPEFRDDILEPIEILGLDQFADSAIIIKARTKTKPIQQWRVGREFNRRMKKKFDELGIEIPFPHVTLYMGQDKQENAPPMNISMKK